MGNYPDILLANTAQTYNMPDNFFSLQNRFSGTRNPVSKSSLRDSAVFAISFLFPFPVASRFIIRLARLSIDRLAQDTELYADSIRCPPGLRGRRRADEDARCRVGPGAIPAMHNYHDKTRRCGRSAAFTQRIARGRRYDRDSAFARSEICQRPPRDLRYRS